MNVTGMVHFNVNCSDFERSRRFYQALGFHVVWEVPEEGGADVGRGVGLGPYRLRGALMALERDPRVVIDLLEWKEPRDGAPPYARLNHLGIARVAFATSDLDADVAELRARGVELVSEPVLVPTLGAHGTRFVCFKDPDGTVLELVQAVGE